MVGKNRLKEGGEWKRTQIIKLLKDECGLDHGVAVEVVKSTYILHVWNTEDFLLI